MTRRFAPALPHTARGPFSAAAALLQALRAPGRLKDETHDAKRRACERGDVHQPYVESTVRAQPGVMGIKKARWHAGFFSRGFSANQ
jgi:hypothetical protein